MTDIVTSVSGGTGHIELNRPKALNALTMDMVHAIDAALQAWESDDAVTRVLLTSASPKAYCAGGDIRAIRDQVVAGEDFTPFFRDEYEMNLRLAEFPKPVIALIDGVNMGGGVGVSIHGSHRVVSEKALIAMPEVAIGFLPDVGATYILGRLPEGVGELMGMTAARIGAGDALAVGLATHFVPSENMGELKDTLLEGGDLDESLARFGGTAPAASLPLDQVAAVFGLGSAPEILAAVGQADGDWAATAREQLATACPTSVFVTFSLVRKAAERTLPQCLAEEAVVGAKLIRRPDFVEGIRAVLVDKTRDPKFSPASFDEIDPQEIAELVGG
ncbi:MULTISPECIES: enoyl-CoA hydratase/isomerase family protein [Tsukamurella]|uniref:3-hydroxyisobutyryl-CoA hydrolase n=1 Tax=Tsukamurella strandjordii TaxID=147577 RepID=A0AA90NA26_9ACTN|nr:MULTISPECIES: enoyl-CoA hydratase/isomerase family protein [Tsukamurella]MDP0397908.1 enoyl-CoA hydratase/isomerase family protein [Tsukamurella strandjordii]GIZ98264.1 putative enoyl-CoA hydratase [Tsukamurella sp. TY48]